MVDDIIDSLLIKQPTYSEVIDFLGEPRSVFPLYSTISYNTFIRIIECPMYNDSDMKFLDIKFDEDSVVSEIRIREYGQIIKKYILNDLKR